MVTQWIDDTPLPTGVEVVAIATSTNDGSSNYPPSTWFSDVGFAGTVVVDDAGDGQDARGTIMKKFGGTGFSYWVAVDSTGKVIERVAGELTEAKYTDLINRIKP